MTLTYGRRKRVRCEMIVGRKEQVCVGGQSRLVFAVGLQKTRRIAPGYSVLFFVDFLSAANLLKFSVAGQLIAATMADWMFLTVIYALGYRLQPGFCVFGIYPNDLSCYCYSGSFLTDFC